MARATATVAVLLVAGGSASAATLSELLSIQTGGRDGILLFDSGSATDTHTAHFSSESLAELGLLIEGLAASAADLPAISTAPSFTYRFNPDLQLVERSTGALGSVFIDTPQTVGARHLEMGASYLFVDFSQLEGDDLDDLSFDLTHQDVTPTGGGPNPSFERDILRVSFDEFELQSHILSFFLTYGITDRWDVNLLVPLIHTTLQSRVTWKIPDSTLGSDGTPVHKFPNGASVENRAPLDEDRTGVGDISLRTKYRFLDTPGGLKGAASFSIRMPSGEEENFQGLGDTVLTPAVLLAQSFGPHLAYANLGFDVNATSSDRSRVRYGIGGSIRLLEQLTFFAELLGSSGLTDAGLSVTVDTFDESGARNGQREVTSQLRTDILDVATGFKFRIVGGLAGYAGALVPITSDGLRADVIPTGGLEMSF